MAEFPERWHEIVARLDGARERKIVAFGAMTLLLFLSVGPTVLSALAETMAALPEKRVASAPAPQNVFIAAQPKMEIEAAEHSSEAAAPAETSIVPPAAPIPPLAFLFPNAGSEVFSPATIAVRAESATTVAMLIEIANAAGERVGTYPASPSSSGDWSALFPAEPGEYVASARASLEDGRVVAFEERRAFRVLAATAVNAPADPSEPAVELIAPDAKSGAYGGIAPLAARVKNGQPSSLVFIVTDADGGETIVLGSESRSSGYWTAMFEGADGGYRSRARATIGERDIFSTDSDFSLRAIEAENP